MSTLTIKDIQEKGLLLYHYYRGSYAQGTFIEGQSDYDTGGVFICPDTDVYGFPSRYIPTVHSDTNDDEFYEIGKWFELLSKSNPTILETLFVEDKFVLYEHPVITSIKKHRDKFITKECFKSFFGYAKTQLEKAKGLNKIMCNEVPTLKSPLDFCYTFYGQGSKKLVDWLRDYGLDQRFCGLVNVPNMHDVYGVYYDWKAWLDTRKGSVYDVFRRKHMKTYDLFMSTLSLSEEEKEVFDIEEYFSSIKPIGYTGIVAVDGSSKQIRSENATEKHNVMLNSVEKGAKPICYMSYNASGYSKHERDYTRYQKWLKDRNPVRYENNLGHNYDAKNCAHCFRLMNMCIEIAKGQGMHVNRENIDRDFLLRVKRHEFPYEELISMLEDKEKVMKEAAAVSKLPVCVDDDFANDLLIKARKKLYAELKKRRKV